MTIKYHGTPINPVSVLHQLAGNHFCVSFFRPDQIVWCDAHGQSLMLDNGAFSAWKSGVNLGDDHWAKYYAWADRWLDRPTTWAVIPDVIDAGSQEQDALIRQWPHGDRGAPVWHMDEPLSRLVRLTTEWPRVCIGSTADYAVVGSAAWDARMDQAWEAIMQAHRRTPNVHMLRGMQAVRWRWPFASVDSTDIARNHNRACNTATAMASSWNHRNPPSAWSPAARQDELFPTEEAR